MKKMLDFIAWIISITLGTIGIYLMNTQNLGFFKTVLYGIFHLQNPLAELFLPAVVEGHDDAPVS